MQISVNPVITVSERITVNHSPPPPGSHGIINLVSIHVGLTLITSSVHTEIPRLGIDRISKPTFAAPEPDPPPPQAHIPYYQQTKNLYLSEIFLHLLLIVSTLFNSLKSSFQEIALNSEFLNRPPLGTRLTWGTISKAKTISRPHRRGGV